jgi:predicted dehydrogenase
MATTVGPYACAGPRRYRNPGGSEMLKVGLVGCGGRGTGAAANALMADDNVKLWALGDTFPDRLDASLKTLSESEEYGAKVDVPEERCFVGWDAYKGVIETCDVIVLATSPHFRPLHVHAAVEAGKHLFVEKPVATDAPGVRSIRESCGIAAEKGLSVVSGLCYRYQDAKRETIRRIQDGAIGDIVAMQCTYNANGLWHRGRKPEWSHMEYQMRNWLYFTWLSGDHIAEQHIHSLDKIAWAMGSYPSKCVSSGGRIVRTDEKYGNVYDHFNNAYEWANGVRCFSSCRQWDGAAANTSDWVWGTHGKSNIQGHWIESGQAWDWRWHSDEPEDMYQNEHDALFAAIRSDEPINDGEYMCNSTLMALMGRMSAYTGKEITWEQALESQEDLSPLTYAWGPIAVAPVAQPGITQFV